MSKLKLGFRLPSSLIVERHSGRTFEKKKHLLLGNLSLNEANDNNPRMVIRPAENATEEVLCLSAITDALHAQQGTKQ